jgi:rhamnosyltransferase
MPIKIAGCVILYYPEHSIAENIRSYINHVEKIYVIDNTETENNNRQLLPVNKSKLNFIHDGVNKGIAERLNQACKLAINNGFDYLLTMDQDSYFDESTIMKYIQCIEQFSDKTQVAMFGINHEHDTQKKNCDFNKASSLITSGSLINLTLFKQIGGFDENLFIDFVDIEYCFRSIEKGWDIIEFPNIYMHHNLGKTSKQRSLKNLQSTERTFHSSLRLYYMCRNFLHINFIYKKKFKPDLQLLQKDLLHRIKNKLLYKNGRFKTISLLLKAWKDFKKNRMGKLSD